MRLNIDSKSLGLQKVVHLSYTRKHTSEIHLAVIRSGSKQIDLQFLVAVLARPQIQRNCREFVDDRNS